MSPETVNRPQPSTADFEICLGQRELTTKASEPCWKKLQFGLILSQVMICEVFTFQGPGNTIVKMKSWHKHCTKKSQVQEARWAPQNQIWGALPGKWCENDALDADWLNFQGVKFSIARIQENIEVQCASNLNNHALTRSMLNWTSNMCKVVRMMEHSAPQSATLRKRPKNKSTSLESGPGHPVMTVCLEHPQCHEATLFCGLINCKSSMTWMTWQVSEIASLLFTIWMLVSLVGFPTSKLLKQVGLGIRTAGWTESFWAVEAYQRLGKQGLCRIYQRVTLLELVSVPGKPPQKKDLEKIDDR